MASSSISLSEASSSFTPSWKYDVFLSFRGEDTRRNFTDHLHEALKRFGINTFIDDQLRRGEQISPALLQAIEDSRCSIIIFSQNYASSSWCLDELAKILECVHKGKHTAFPVFHEVDPSDVRKQRGSYAEAFQKHEEAYKNNMAKVVKWREALTEASGYSGWDTRDRYQSEVIKEIVWKNFNKVIDVSSSNMEPLVGMDSRIEAVLSLLCLESPKVRTVGIWGMAGIGKTTIAEAIYQIIHTQFECSCFLSNVRGNSWRNDKIQMEPLSEILWEKNLDTRILNRGPNFVKKALRYMKVLIVLDDVNNIKQLEELVGHDNCFGSESRIIITTRDKRLLTEKDVDAIYEAKELQKDEALELFCQYAFKQEPFGEEFEELCHHYLYYTKGNPLVLKILGRFLYKRSRKEWESQLEKLRKIPNKDVQEILRISFDGLDDNQKNIFLDIACFFNGEDKSYISEILKCCDFHPEIDISILVEKALITVSLDNRLSMHDLIQEMGWEIVRQQSIEDPGRRSRLCMNDDVVDVLTTNIGTETIQGIVLDLSTLNELEINVDVFRKMIKLRVLKFYVTISCPYSRWRVCLLVQHKLHLIGDFKFISNNLRYFWWEGYPLKSLPSNFHPRKVFELNMSFSRLEQLWEGNKPCPNLTYMNLSYSRDLIKTPDLSGAPNLRTINLKGCTSLVEVHSSIGTLEKLSSLQLTGCSKLEELPTSIGKVTSLEYLDLYDCSKLKALPKSIGKLTSLKTLNLRGCSKMETLPNSIGKLTSLQDLCLWDCSNLEKLPESLGKMKSLICLSLLDCSKLRKLPEDMGTSLVKLFLSGCSKLKKLPNDIGSLQRLDFLEGDGSGIQEIPPSFSCLARLGYLSLAGRPSWECSSSTNLAISRQGLRFPSYLGLGSLYDLELSECNLQEGALPSDMSSLCSLQRLRLSRNNFITLPSLTPLTRLETLEVRSCKSLQLLTKLPLSISGVLASDCESLETFSHPPNSYAMLQSMGLEFDFCNCTRLQESVSLEALLLRIPRSTLQADKSWEFDAVVPGSSIPEWFIHQSLGNSIIVKLPPDFDIADVTRPIGVAFCAVLGKRTTPHALLSRLDCDHIWSGYQPIVVRCNDTICGYDRALSKRRLDHKRDNEHPHLSHLKFSFSSYRGLFREAPEVKKCGIRLLYVAERNEEMKINQLHNGDAIELDTVAAISCPPRMVFFKEEDCPRRNLSVGYAHKDNGVRILVEGYHKYVHKSLALARKEKRVGTSLMQNPSQSELSEDRWWETNLRIDGRFPIKGEGYRKYVSRHLKNLAITRTRLKSLATTRERNRMATSLTEDSNQSKEVDAKTELSRYLFNMFRNFQLQSQKDAGLNCEGYQFYQ